LVSHFLVQVVYVGCQFPNINKSLEAFIYTVAYVASFDPFPQIVFFPSTLLVCEDLRDYSFSLVPIS
jgi:hypothetical protein